MALPRVLKRGVEIGRHTDHKGRDYGTVTFAAPVTINGKTGNMAVVVKLTSENFYKTHRILTPDEKVYELQEMTNAEPTPAGESLSNSSLAAPISSASNASVTDKSETVKRDYSLRGARDLEHHVADLQKQNARLQAWESALRESRGKTVETAERQYLLANGRTGGSAAQTSGRITRAKAAEAVYEVLDHGDKGHDNLVLLGDMPRYIRELTGIEGDLYIYRNHAYENMVSEERAIAEGRPGGKRAHYHELGEETMVEAIMALENPSVVISDQMKAGNPALSLVLPVFGDNDAPIHAAVSFYENTDINGSLAKRPHVAITFYEHPYDQPAGSRYRGLVEIVQKAIDEGKILSVNKKIRADQPVMTERTSLGNIARSSLEKNVAQFRKEVNAFKERNRINYSLRGARDLEHQVADLQKQNARLQARNEELRSRLESGGTVKVDEAEAKRMRRSSVRNMIGADPA